MTGGKNGDTALTVSGCTFYGNQTGAIYWSSGPITLTGNIFWGNGNIDRYGVTSGGYNVFDMASSSTFGVTDNQITTIPISPVNYKPLTGSGAWEHISSRPQDYPVLDFYGVPIPASNAASGAVQTQAAAGYTLEYGVNGKGTISISGPAPNSDGLYAGGSILTLQASPGSGSVFGYWTINGLRQEEQTPPNQISLTMNAHNNVKATFGWVVNNANSGSGSLLEALTNQEDEQFIYLPAGQTITLASPLPAITKNISIEGNGATLTQSGFTSDYGSMLLRISNSNAEVVIRHLHFKGGRAVEGAAIRTEGKLSVESCIFSDNQASRGGALYCATSSGTLIVSGCTFYGNTAVVTVNYAYGGAIYVWQGSLTLTGNIFMGNTSSTSTGKVVYNSGGTVSSGGYNVSDYASGTNTTTGSGWTFALTDIQVTDTAFNIAWQPTSATTPLNIITSLPTGFPATYFDGSTRTIPATPGAMPQL
jgi:predicted outer membrane repeat protein